MNNETIRDLMATKIKEERTSLLCVARQCGVDQASLWRFMNNKSGLSGTNILKILQYINVSPEVASVCSDNKTATAETDTEANVVRWNV